VLQKAIRFFPQILNCPFEDQSVKPPSPYVLAIPTYINKYNTTVKLWIGTKKFTLHFKSEEDTVYHHAKSPRAALNRNVWAYLHVEDVMVCIHVAEQELTAAVCRRPLWWRVMMCVTQLERKEVEGSRVINHLPVTREHTNTRIFLHTHAHTHVAIGMVLSLQLDM